MLTLLVSSLSLLAAPVVPEAGAPRGHLVTVEQLTSTGPWARPRLGTRSAGDLGAASAPVAASEVGNAGPASGGGMQRAGAGGAAVSEGVIAACREAEAQDRPAPDGVDCMAAMQAAAENAPLATAESSLLEMMYGLSGNITGDAPTQAAQVDAEALARQVAARNAADAASLDAARLGRQRPGAGAPPPR